MRQRRFHFADVCVILLICFGIVIRFLRFDIPFDSEDVHLDYLVGHQIVRHVQIPWSGSGNPLLVDGPLYYYIVAAFLWIKDSLLFLGVVNIVLIQGITFWLLYRLATELFDKKTGILTVLFAVFSLEYIEEGAYFFQTHVMQVFVIGSLLCLTLAYKRKNSLYAFASGMLFATAISIHHSVLALAPMYVLVFFVIVRQFARRQILQRIFVVGVSTFLFWHILTIGLILEYNSTVWHMKEIITTGIVYSPHAFWEKFLYNMAQFFSTFSFRWGEHLFVMNMLAGGVLVVSMARFLYAAERQKRLLVEIILIAIVWFVFIASFLQKGVWSFTFSSLFGLYLTVIAASIADWFASTSPWSKVIGFISMLFVLFVFSNGFIFLEAWNYPRFARWNIAQESAQLIQKKVLELKQGDGRSNLSFFRIQRVHKRPMGGFFVDVYTDDDIQVIEDLLYWPILQTTLGTNFVRVEKNGSFPRLLSTDDYVFVVCDSSRNAFLGTADCTNRYLAYNPQYEVVEQLYETSRITIVVVRKVVL